MHASKGCYYLRDSQRIILLQILVILLDHGGAQKRCPNLHRVKFYQSTAIKQLHTWLSLVKSCSMELKLSLYQYIISLYTLTGYTQIHFRRFSLLHFKSVLFLKLSVRQIKSAKQTYLQETLICLISCRQNLCTVYEILRLISRLCQFR